jgi:hypothetical protein
MVVVAVLLLVGICQSPPGRSILKAVGLIGSPTSFTAIAFAKPQSLPVQLASPHTKLDLSFTISNDTSNMQDYQWTVSVVADNKSTLASNGYIQLAPNGAVTVARDINIVCKAGQAEVTVGLKNTNEHVDAWMTCG